MASDSRYELLDKIGSGSFASVYRARDKELGREVAVKQIHEQFLAEPEMLDRYWQEAQLLASLNHPNIITFYDVDRDRGWLIMELMHGNLADRLSGRQMNIKSLRSTVAQVLRALKYLHSRGIVHGDIKPSNLMIDDRKRIKLGDFGLARRASDEDGSLLKGTTKYMAPEVMSDEFGEVGSPSDLYSLGFAAYELLCGPNFESLFPGLSAFGRDKQVAWMMWHAAADRKLPQVHKVLEGVPEDLTTVIERLTQKQPEDRYEDAEEALSDLSVDVKIINKGGDSDADDAIKAAEEAEAKKKRMVAIGAFCASLLMCVVMLIDFGGGKEVVDNNSNEPISGIVRNVLLEDSLFIIEKDGRPEEIKFGSSPKILLNDKNFILPRDLQMGDRVSIVEIKNDNGGTRLEINATRPDVSDGYVKEIQASNSRIIVSVEGQDRAELLVSIGDDTRISVNGESAKFDDLKIDDRIRVSHIADTIMSGAREATSIIALQEKQMQGILREVSIEKKQFVIEIDEDGKPVPTPFAIADECEVTVNGKQVMAGKLLRPVDLQPGDEVTVKFDKAVYQVRAARQFRFAGVLQEMKADVRSLVIQGDSEKKVFVVQEDCEFLINGKTAGLADLRRNDQLVLSYDNSNANPQVSAIEASRPIAGNRWVILIANQDYDDNSLTKLPFAVSDAELMRDTLLNRYSCSADQVLLLKNETRVRLEQAIPEWLGKIPANGQLVFYVVGNAYLNEEGAPFYAAKDFALSRVNESGLPLSWLREQLESCEAAEKLLLLDCAHAGDGQDLQKQPATSDMLDALKPSDDPAVFKSTNAIASSMTGQRGLDWADKNHGLFAHFLAQAYAGRGDKNEDVHLEPTELYDYIKAEMLAVTIDDQKQIPALFLPDDTPPPEDRLTAAAKQAVKLLMAKNWTQTKVADTAISDFDAAHGLVGENPDARLAYATILLKGRDRRSSLQQFEQVRSSHPGMLATYVGAAWIHCEDDRFTDAIGNLQSLITKILARAQEAEAIDPRWTRFVEIAGRLREFSEVVAEKSRRPSVTVLDKLDALLTPQQAELYKAYRSGRETVQKIDTEFADKISEESSPQKVKLLELDRKRLIKYAPFDYDLFRQAIIQDLDVNNLPE